MSQRRIESFLLRLIVEDQVGCNPEAWRGRVQHVGTGHEHQFANVGDLITFISEQFSVEALPFNDSAPPTVHQAR